MPIDFPDNPIAGDTFTSNGKTWEFDGASWSAKMATSSVASGSITVDKLADGAVHTAKVADDAVTTSKIAAGAITATELGTGAVTAGKIDSLAVTSSKIAADAVTESKIATGAVSEGKIASSAVTAGKIASGAITTEKIAAGAVTAAKLGNDISLTPPDNSITQAKMAQGLSVMTICTSSTRPAQPFIGQLIFETDTNKMKVYTSGGWSVGTSHFTIDGLTEETAAPSATYLMTTLGYSSNGYYWIKPTGTNLARQVWCDLQTLGGGWMLMSFTGTGNTTGSHVIDTYSGSAFNMESTSTTVLNTAQANGTAGNLGQTFINNMVVAHRSKAVALFRIHDAGTTWKNWYFQANANSSWLTLTSRQGGGATASDQSNTWLLTAYSSYTADLGNSGAGTVGGSTYAYNNETWPSYPGNIAASLVDNWGYSIASTYPGGFSQYPSCHSNGWNRAGSFWLKVGT